LKAAAQSKQYSLIVDATRHKIDVLHQELQFVVTFEVVFQKFCCQFSCLLALYETG
jgi:hypothetical protein